MPWCQILVDDPGNRDERTFKRLIRDVPAAGDLIDVDGQKALVTTVSRIPPRSKSDNLSVLIYCRPQ